MATAALDMFVSELRTHRMRLREVCDAAPRFSVFFLNAKHPSAETEGNWTVE